MKVIGLTGGIGAGKSTVSQYLKEKGYLIIDADQMAHDLTALGSPVLAEIAETFGSEMLFPDGNLDRKKLAAVVFADKEKLEILENLTTRRVVTEIKEKLELLRAEKRNRIVFVDAPLLFEVGVDHLMDFVFMVNADTEVRIGRVAERDHISRQQVLARMASQMDEREKEEKSTEVIDNSKGKEALYQQIDALLEKYAETK